MLTGSKLKRGIKNLDRVDLVFSYKRTNFKFTNDSKLDTQRYILFRLYFMDFTFYVLKLRFMNIGFYVNILWKLHF